MKTSVNFLNGLSFKNTANFEKNATKLLPSGVNEIYFSSVGMIRVGTGSYKFFLDIEINKEKITLTSFTNDSQSFDYYKHDLEYKSRNHDNWCKQTVLMLLEECQHEIIELIDEEESNN